MQVKVYPPLMTESDLDPDLKKVIDVFKSKKVEIDSTTHKAHKHDVLDAVRGPLQDMGYEVRNGRTQRVQLPVTDNVQYDVDAYNSATSIAVDVEAGRARMNNAFLRDIVDVSLMADVDHLVLAVPIKWDITCPFAGICDYLDAFYKNGRISLPLKPIVIIGY